ncbi:MAG TPA: biopolymer transporter ExbD [Flavitalea sp.]|nr:biopolymer transporter ExbD [Flavitalea sp.]
MADFACKQISNTAPRVKKVQHSTKVDLTPMVDLGFLLITFFIFTTTISEPTALKLIVPKDSIDSMKVKEKASLTILASENDDLYYYEAGLHSEGRNLHSTNYRNITKILHTQKNLLHSGYFMVIIKPSPASTYKNTVDLLDEMLINDVKRYAISDMTNEELNLISASPKQK